MRATLPFSVNYSEISFIILGPAQLFSYKSSLFTIKTYLIIICVEAVANAFTKSIMKGIVSN